MKILIFTIVAVTCIGVRSAQSGPELHETGLPLMFWTADDVEEIDGQIQFGAEPLRLAGRAVGFPEMQYACEAPADDGGSWIYGWRNVDWSDRSKRTTEVIRCRTTDGKTFSDTQTVYRHTNKDWQGFSNIVRRPTDGALFLFSWAPASLHVFKSDHGTDWRLLTEKAYGDHDAMCVTWHRQLGSFVNYQHTLQPFEKRYPDNIGNYRRVMSFRQSTDGVQWMPISPQFLQGNTLWLPDDQDPVDLEFYRCVVFPCQGRYAMLLLDYMPHPQAANPRRATTKHSSRYLTEWAISHDGLNWRRPFRTTDAVEQVIWTPLQGPLVRNGMLLFYSSSGQMAVLPDDQIFYVTCRSNGYFSTPLFKMPAGGLALNATARYRPGEDPGQAAIMAELRDENNAILAGFEMPKCLIENREGRKIPLLWEGANGKEHAGQKVRLRFLLRDAKIYAVTKQD